MKGIIANIDVRLRNLIDMSIPQRNGITGYRVNAASTLDDAYGNVNGVGGSGTSNLFEVSTGSFFKSPKLSRGRVGPEITKRTRAVFNPDEFYSNTTQAPEDTQVMFMRVEQFSTALGTYEAEGPINIIMPYNSMGVRRPALSLYGTAPSVTCTAGAIAPDDALHFHLHLYAVNFQIKNHGVASMFVALGSGLPMLEISAGDSLSLFDTNITEVFIAGNGSNPTFSIAASLQNGP